MSSWGSDRLVQRWCERNGSHRRN